MKDYISEIEWSKHKGIISFLVLVIMLLIYLTFFNQTSEPNTYVSTVVQPEPVVGKTRVVKTEVKTPERRSKRSSFVDLTDSQGELYDALEASTRAYLTKLVGPSIMKDYDFDPDGKIKISVKEYFELSEQAIVNEFRFKVINTPLLDTIKNDTLDLRMIVYK